MGVDFNMGKAWILKIHALSKYLVNMLFFNGFTRGFKKSTAWIGHQTTRGFFGIYISSIYIPKSTPSVSLLRSQFFLSFSWRSQNAQSLFKSVVRFLGGGILTPASAKRLGQTFRQPHPFAARWNLLRFGISEIYRECVRERTRCGWQSDRDRSNKALEQNRGVNSFRKPLLAGAVS